MTIESMIEATIGKEGRSTGKMVRSLLRGLPLGFHAVPELSIIDASLSGIVGKGRRNTAIIDKFGDPPVVRLRRGSSPSAVTRLIATLDIDPVERGPGRTRPHIGKKCIKTTEPTLAHSNTSPAIFEEFGVLRVEAAPFGMCPRTEFRSRLPANRMTVPQRPLSGSLRAQAPAACGAPGANMVKARHYSAAALAGEEPLRFPAFHTREGGQSTECGAGQIKGSDHVN